VERDIKLVEDYSVKSEEDKLREDLLSVIEVAKWLGLAKETIYQWVHYKKIPYTKVNGGLRFEYSEIDRFIKNGRRCKAS